MPILLSFCSSCDIAFIATDSEQDDNLYFTVNVSSSVRWGLILGISACLVLVAAVGIRLVNDLNQMSLDGLWVIEPEELKFADTPQVIGRGTFGLVLLGEYRGTWVAVKRAVPFKESKRKISVSNEGGKERESRQKHSSEEDDYVDLEAVRVGPSKPVGREALTRGISAAAFDMSMSTGSVKKSFLGTGKRFAASSFPKFSLGSWGKNSSGRYPLGRRGMAATIATRRKLKKDFIDEMRQLSNLRHPCVTTVMGKSSCETS